MVMGDGLKLGFWLCCCESFVSVFTVTIALLLC